MLQLFQNDFYAAKADRQHEQYITIEAQRGVIFDRYMEPLALSLIYYSVCADPRRIDDKEGTAAILSEILDIEKETILKQLQKDKSFVWIKRKISDAATSEIQDKKLKGIFLRSEIKRTYPNDELASHVVGFAGIDNEGLEGVELMFNKELIGQKGYRHVLRDARFRSVLSRNEDSKMPVNGHNVVLTIDSVIQVIVEGAIKKIGEKYHTESISCVVLEPDTGKILAMANYPNFKLNDYGDSPEEARKNLCVTDVFEPGSVFKIITFSAAINESTVKEDDVFDCEMGEYKVGGRILHDYHPYGKLSVKQILEKSSNIGTVKIAQKLGADKIYEYIKTFGFGELAGVDLPGEVQGLLRHPKVWSKSDITTIPIGQGIAVTAIQLASAVSVVANGGFLLRPSVIEKISTIEGKDIYQFTTNVRRKVINTNTCDIIKQMMADVVTSGTGKNAASKKYEFCGKTGTAQKVNPNGGYFDSKYYATFVGFAPKEKPVITIVIAANDPHPEHFGGTVCAPAFKEIAEKSLEYLGVPRRDSEMTKGESQKTKV
ncbi:MAG: penicillin-binding protein [Candidatus Omnitrophica bacterium]|nr:penicillin-binding protein [Candidatus Omnitrophota bacterium]